jgi:hypothetical protein
MPRWKVVVVEIKVGKQNLREKKLSKSLTQFFLIIVP